MMLYAIIFIIIILIIDIIINNQKQSNIENNYNNIYQKKNYLLTQEELKFYKLLKSITNKYNLNVFTQVALYQIIKSKNMTAFNKIKSKTVDFVITDTNCQIKLCIELDDSSHIKEERQKRDNFINELFTKVNIKLIRISVQNYYNLQELEEKIKESL